MTIGQPVIVQPWVQFRVDIVGVNQHLFATVFAVAETALAVALIVGVLSNLAYFGGGILSLAIWSTAEGFGRPYPAGSVDIAAAVIYTWGFGAIFFTAAGYRYGLDRYLTPRLGRWGFSPRGRSIAPAGGTR